MRIAVLFSKKDVETFSDTLNDETIVIGDISCKLRVREHLYPSLDIRLEKEVSALIREMFISFESKTGAESVKGFANNFYECAVAPIVAYVSTLSRVIKNLQSSGEEVEVWFPSRLLFSPKYSAYFLAEHESQGRRLYSRESVFLPYLEQVCKLHGVPVKYKMTRFGAVSYFQRIARVFAVFLWRLSHGIVSSIKKSVPPFQRLNSVDFFAISRTVGQTEFLIPFLDRTGLVTSLVAAESALGKGRNARLVHDLTAENSAFSGVLVETSIQYMLKKYLKAIFLIFRKPSMRLESSGIELNLDQAFTEVLVMWPELLAYRSASTLR